MNIGPAQFLLSGSFRFVDLVRVLFSVDRISSSFAVW